MARRWAQLRRAGLRAWLLRSVDAYGRALAPAARRDSRALAGGRRPPARHARRARARAAALARPPDRTGWTATCDRPRATSPSGLAIDLVAIAALVYGLFYPRHRRMDLVVVYALFNVGVFLALSVIVAGEVSMGVGFGLFAVLSIVRLRSEPFSNRELAYFFVALVIGLVCALDVGHPAYAGLLAGVALLAAWAIDHPRLSRPSRRLEVTLERVFADDEALREHLRERLRAPVLDVTVLRDRLRARDDALEVRLGPRRRRMVPSPSLIAEAFPAIGLERLDAGAALRDRVDVKYVIPLAAFAALADRLLATHTALEIDGRRAFAYRSTYFDTPELVPSATTSSSAGGATSAARASTSTAARTRSRSSSRASAAGRSSTAWRTTGTSSPRPRSPSCATASTAPTAARRTAGCGRRWPSPTRA